MTGENAWRILRHIEGEAAELKRRGHQHVYKVLLILRSGEQVQGVAGSSTEQKSFLELTLGNDKKTYIPYDAIDQVTPIWS